MPRVFPAFAVDQVPVAVTVAWLQGDGDPPGAVAVAVAGELDVLGRPIVEVAAQRHALGLDVRGKSEGDLDGAGLDGAGLDGAGLDGADLDGTGLDGAGFGGAGVGGSSVGGAFDGHIGSSIAGDDPAGMTDQGRARRWPHGRAASGYQRLVARAPVASSPAPMNGSVWPSRTFSN